MSAGRTQKAVAVARSVESDDEWMLLSARGTTSRPVLLRNTSPDQPSDAEQSAGSPTRDVDSRGEVEQQAVAVGSFQADSESEKDSPQRVMRHQSSFNDDEFFESDGYFSVLKPAETASGAVGVAPRSIRLVAGASAEVGADRGPRKAATPSSQAATPSSPATAPSSPGSTGSPGRDVPRSMPQRGLSALESFLFGSDGDVFGLEAIAAAMNAPAVASDLAWPTQPGSTQPQTESEQPQQPREGEEGTHTTRASLVASKDGTHVDAEANSQPTLFTAMTLCFTWAVLSTTTQRSTVATVASTMTVTAIGLGGAWKLFASKSTTQNGAKPDGRNDAVEMHRTPVLDVQITECLVCCADLCGGSRIADAPPVASDGAPLPPDQLGTHETGYASFRRDVARIPPLLRLLTTFLALELLVAPSQSISGSALLRGTSLFVSLFALTRAALGGLRTGEDGGSQ